MACLSSATGDSGNGGYYYVNDRSSVNARRLVLSLVALALLAGCGRKIARRLVPPEDISTLDAKSPFLKAHLANGNVYVLSGWRVDSTSTAILGSGALLDVNRMEIAAGDFRLPADSVVLFETNVEGASGARAALTVMAGVTAVVAGICAASPKTCFGSCPTFYAPSRSGSMELQAEGFSSSIAPALEATDIDMLLHTAPTSRHYTLRVTNEALETHVIRHADLLAAPHSDGGRAYITSDDIFRETFDAMAPTGCSASEGDCLASVLEADVEERFSLADSTDLATRETIELEFDNVPAGELGLVVVSRQTLMTTFLIYQALAYMGNEAGRWLAALETGGNEARERVGGVGRVLGDIEVLLEDENGEWVVVGSVGETGPIAADTRVVPLPVEYFPHRIRLRLTKGMWRLDQVALVRLGDEIMPQRLMPLAVERQGVDDPNALRALVEREEALVTLPGDAYEISYRLPENPAGYDLFLEARGYYLEWMRQEWLEEENPLRAAQLILDPGGALRALAPAFKIQEPTIEHLFWNSRYVGH